MRAPKRRRPIRREQIEAPVGVDLVVLAHRASYGGSPEHKDTPSPAGPPRLRADATACPRDLRDVDQLTTWLRGAIASGQIGAPWEGDFPRYAWIRNGRGCFEARLTNRVLGTYKGYPLKPDEEPSWL
jgi:hypothetical protein